MKEKIEELRQKILALDLPFLKKKKNQDLDSELEDEIIDFENDAEEIEDSEDVAEDDDLEEDLSVVDKIKNFVNEKILKKNSKNDSDEDIDIEDDEDEATDIRVNPIDKIKNSILSKIGKKKKDEDEGDSEGTSNLAEDKTNPDIKINPLLNITTDGLEVEEVEERELEENLNNEALKKEKIRKFVIYGAVLAALAWFYFDDTPESPSPDTAAKDKIDQEVIEKRKKIRLEKMEQAKKAQELKEKIEAEEAAKAKNNIEEVKTEPKVEPITEPIVEPKVVVPKAVEEIKEVVNKKPEVSELEENDSEEDNSEEDNSDSDEPDVDNIEEASSDENNTEENDSESVPTESTELNSNKDLDPVPGSGEGAVTSEILKRLEERANEEAASEAPVKYIAEPSYEYGGRGLVYSCSAGHWACVDAGSYFQCQENYKFAKSKGNALECKTAEVYASDKDCDIAQQMAINTKKSDGYCEK